MAQKFMPEKEIFIMSSGKQPVEIELKLILPGAEAEAAVAPARPPSLCATPSR